MKKFIFIIIILMLTGCTDYKELNNMAIVNTIGLDKDKDNYEVVVQVAKPISNNKNNIESIIYKSKGKTLHSALRNTTLECPKKLYLGHLSLIIVSESISKEGLKPFLDFILRDTETEKNINIIITENKILEFMNALKDINNISKENISEKINLSSKLQGSTVNITLDKFVETIVTKGIDPVLPVANIYDNGKNKNIKIENKIAIFKNDKLKSYLYQDSALAFNLIKNNINSNLITFKCNKNNYSSIELIRNNIKLNIDNNKINISGELIGTISEINCKLDLNNTKNIDEYETKIEIYLKKIIDDLFINYNIKESDYLGIKKYMIKNNINKEIENLKLDINIKVTINQKAALRKEIK